MDIDKLSIAKSAARWITAAGSSKIVHDIIRNNVDPPETLVNKAKILVGGVAIAGVVSAHASNYAGEKFDEAVNLVNEFKTEFKKEDTE